MTSREKLGIKVWHPYRIISPYLINYSRGGGTVIRQYGSHKLDYIYLRTVKRGANANSNFLRDKASTLLPSTFHLLGWGGIASVFACCVNNCFYFVNNFTEKREINTPGDGWDGKRTAGKIVLNMKMGKHHMENVSRRKRHQKTWTFIIKI